MFYNKLGKWSIKQTLNSDYKIYLKVFVAFLSLRPISLATLNKFFLHFLSFFFIFLEQAQFLFCIFEMVFSAVIVMMWCLNCLGWCFISLDIVILEEFYRIKNKLNWKNLYFLWTRRIGDGVISYGFIAMKRFLIRKSDWKIQRVYGSNPFDVRV